MKLLRKYSLLAVLLGAAVVEAQTAPPQAKALSAAEMRLKVEQIQKEIDGDHRHVLHLQALARKEKDVIKLTCVNDKLVQLKAQMNLFETASLQVDAALGAGDDSPTAVFADLETAGNDVKKLRGEADGCAGELEMYKQESRSSVEAPELDDPTANDPNLSSEDTTQVDAPGYATPYK